MVVSPTDRTGAEPGPWHGPVRPCRPAVSLRPAAARAGILSARAPAACRGDPTWMDRPPSPLFSSTRQQHPGRWERVGRVVRWGLVVVAIAAVAGAVLLWRHAAGRVQGERIEAVATREHTPATGQAADRPTNVLIVEAGSGGPVGTVALVQTAPDRDTPVVLLLPRTLWIHPPGGEPGRLGGALSAGGPGRLVGAVESTLGLDVDHFVQIDPQAVSRLADVVGGLEVCLDEPARGQGPGRVEAGCARRSGDDVGALLSSGRERARLRHQRAVLAGALGAATRPDLLLHPLRLRRVLDVLGDAVVVSDRGLGIRQMVVLGRRLSRIDELTLDVRTVPGWLDEQSGTVYLLPGRAQSLFAALRRGGALPEDLGTGQPGAGTLTPEQVTVSVYNGTGRIALASNGAEMLAAEGFGIATRDNAEEFGHRKTVIRYVPGHEGHARLVARRFPGAGLERLEGPREDGAQVVVLLGRDAEPVVAEAQRRMAGRGSGGGSGGTR